MYGQLSQIENNRIEEIVTKLLVPQVQPLTLQLSSLRNLVTAKFQWAMPCLVGMKENIHRVVLFLTLLRGRID